MMTNSGTYLKWLIPVILIVLMFVAAIVIAICCRKRRQKGLQKQQPSKHGSDKQTPRNLHEEEQMLPMVEREYDRQTEPGRVTYEVVPRTKIPLIVNEVKGIINEVKGNKPCSLHCVIYNPSCRIGDINIIKKIEDSAIKQPVLLIDTGTQRNFPPSFEEKFKYEVTVIYLQTISGKVKKTENNTKSIKAIRRLIKDLIDK